MIDPYELITARVAFEFGYDGNVKYLSHILRQKQQYSEPGISDAISTVADFGGWTVAEVVHAIKTVAGY